MLGAFALRLGAMCVLHGGLDRPYVGDENLYVRLAVSLAEGRGFVNKDGTPHALRCPGIPFMLSLVFRVTGPSIPAARLLMCVLATLLVPVCYALGTSLGDRRVGLLSAVGAAVFPNWVYYSGYVLADLVSALTVATTAWLLIEGWRRNSLRWFVAGGLVWACGALARPTNLAFVPAVVLWVLVAMPNWRRRAAAGAAVCLPFACAIAPWCIRNSLALEHPLLLSTQGGIALWIGNNPASTGVLGPDYRHYMEGGNRRFSVQEYPDPLERSAAYKAEAVEFIRENPGRFLRLCAIRFAEFWKMYSPRVPVVESLVMIASFGLALPFFLLQAAKYGWRRGPEMLLLLMIACQTAVHTIFTAVVRYRIPVEPLVLVMAVAGLCGAWNWLRKSPSAKTAQPQMGG